ncbi:MAG TPA: PhoU domain-containing protein, partial [Stellaceae bacterium]|nr:PhoU domain-containing protein [Stellaceae bacterium]
VYTGLFRELLTYMMEDPRSITAGTHLLFIAKNIERIGDHVTNIAEAIYFLVHGKPLKLTRPKRDRTSSAIVLPGITGVIEGDGNGESAE